MELRSRSRYFLSFAALAACLLLLVADDAGPPCAPLPEGYYELSSDCDGSRSGALHLVAPSTSAVISGDAKIEIADVDETGRCSDKEPLQDPKLTLSLETVETAVGAQSYRCTGWKGKAENDQTLVCQRPSGSTSCTLSLRFLAKEEAEAFRCASFAGRTKTFYLVPEESCWMLEPGRIRLSVPAQSEPPSEQGTVEILSGVGSFTTSGPKLSYDRRSCRVGSGVGKPDLITIVLSAESGIYQKVIYSCAATPEAWGGGTVSCDKTLRGSYAGSCRLTLTPVAN